MRTADIYVFQKRAGSLTEDDDGRFCRADEEQTERCYGLDELTAHLEGASFELLGVFSDYSFSAPTEKTERWYVVARAKK